MSLTKTQANTHSAPVFNITSHGATHTGRVRTRNEDSILMLEHESIWAVADGMGGHHAGDFASQTITNNLGLFKQQAMLEDSILLLEENLLNSNAIIHNKARKLGKNESIGSTVVCVYLWRNYAFTFWAGDSRLYRYRKNQFERLTEDHSYVEELVKLGKIEASAAESHPAANVVLKAVGIYDTLCIDFDCFELEEEDILIICSDGLYKDLNEDAIPAIVEKNTGNMEALSKSLLDAALNAGGSDNTSIITLKVGNNQNNV